MGTLVFLVCYLCVLFFWDIILRLIYLVSSTWAHTFFTRLSKRLGRLTFALTRTYGGLRTDFRNDARRRLPPNFVVVCNHQSLADIPALVSAFPDHNLKFIAKKALRRGLPVVSFGLQMGKHATIDRSGSFADTMRQLSRLSHLTSQGYCPVVFPEGTRSRTGHLLRFHSGALRIVLQRNPIPVVSVAVDGGYAISRFTDVLFHLGDVVYRLRVLNVHMPPTGKKGAADLLGTIRAEIAAQITNWRDPAT